MTVSSQPLILGLGELLWDIFGEVKRPGGAPANVAFHAKQMGADSALLSRVGEDDPGRELLAFLEKQGMKTDTIQEDPNHSTGRVTVDSSRPDRPEYTIHENVAWDYLELDALWKKYLGRASAVCFGSLAQRSPKSRKTILDCLDMAEQSLRVFDINLRPPYIDGEALHQSLELSEVVKFNLDEMEPLSQILLIRAKPDQPELFCEKLFDRFQQTNTVCITRAEHGCLLYDRNQGMAEKPGISIQVADTVGAGDTFTAGLAVGLLSGWTIDQVADFANRAAALTASKSGAMPVLREEFSRIRSEIIG